MEKKLLLVFCLYVLVQGLAILPIKCEDILIGHIGNESGEFKKYAAAINTGIETCFFRINKEGGIAGKHIKLVSRNDNGNPLKTQVLVEDLKKQGISIFLGNMGTRNVMSLLPQIERGDISMLFPWSGDNSLRNPSLKNIINGPGLLEGQIKALAEHLCNKLNLKKITIFHADDTFSKEGVALLETLCKKFNTEVTAIASYNRRTLNIQNAAKKLMALEPKAVVCIGTSMPSVKLLKHFFTQGLYTTLFFGIDSTFMAPDILAETGASFSYTAAVPNPKMSLLPIAKNYLHSLGECGSGALPNVLSFTYYICAQILVDALKKTTSRSDMITYLENLKNYEIEGFPINFDSTNRHLFGNSAYLIKD